MSYMYLIPLSFRRIKFVVCNKFLDKLIRYQVDQTNDIFSLGESDRMYIHMHSSCDKQIPVEDTC